MPPMTSQASHSHRASFYGRSRTTSNDSSDSQRSSKSSSSSTSSRQNRGSKSVATSSSSLPSKASSSSSPQSKDNMAVALAAATAATKRAHGRSSAVVSSSSSASIQIHIEGTKEENQKKSLTFDEPEYQEEAIAHMHHMESETIACVDLMDAQPELRWFMRPYLVDFIVEIHQTFRLRPETLYLTMNIVDRYVSKRIVYKRHFQLVGCASLLIAAKFEDSKDKVPTVSELSQMCCSAYDESAFTQMEGHVLSTIGWVLGYPSPEAWLRISCMQRPMDLKTQSVARFLMEASLFHRDFIGMLPSHLSAGALMLARFICGKSGGKTPNESEETIAAAQSIDTFMMENSAELSEILVKKYSFSHFGQASNIVQQWYAKSAQANQAQMAAVATGLLPAQSVSAQHLALHNKAAVAAGSNVSGTSSMSTFSTPQRGQEDVSMRSSCTTPSSMISTPSRMSGDEAEDDDDDDEEEEEEEEEEEDHDMPVTPLSLNSLHDPLVAASGGEVQKENTRMQHHHHPASATKEAAHTNLLQVKAARPALCLSQRGNKMALE